MNKVREFKLSLGLSRSIEESEKKALDAIHELEKEKENLKQIIKNNALAISFQSMKEYRKMLLDNIDKMEQSK